MGIQIGGARSRDEDDEPRGNRYRRGTGDADDAPDRDDLPRRGRGRASSDDEPPRRGSGRSSRDEDEDDRPSRGRGRERDSGGPRRERQRGWAGSKRVREETGSGVRYKLIETDFDLIAFMDDEPFDAAARHFIRELKGQKMFICPGKKGPYKCALCGKGDQPMPVSYFLIAVFDPETGDPELKVWECGPGYIDAIETQTQSRAVNGHLTSCYFEVKGVKSASGKGATKLEINPIRPRDLMEDWKIAPLTDAEFDELLKDAPDLDNYVQFAPESAVRDAAREIERMGD